MRNRAYVLATHLLKDMIPMDAIGIYMLGRGESGSFVPIYVGRSDHSLLDRLLTHNHRNEATHVIWQVTSSPIQAFRLECSYYHLYIDQGYTLLNSIHPGSPAMLRVPCPFCSIILDDLEGIGGF